MASSATRTHATKRAASGPRPVVARVPAPTPAPRDLADLALGVYCWD